ncbi:hypothetical protein A6456_09260 [Paraburkholderia tropica]|nr:hypothetical protein A6456_09260 [Paraburkholderia tropica]
MAEIAVLLEAAEKLGASPMCTLHRTGLTPEVVARGESQATLAQLMSALGNAIERTNDRLLPVRAGAKIHLSAFGIAGYAMWSAASLRAALELATTYRPLLGLKCGPTLSIEGNSAVLYFSPPGNLPETQQDFCVEMELAKVLTFIGDLQLDEFSAEIMVSSKTLPENATLKLLGNDVRIGGDVTQIKFDARLLDESLPQFNPVTNRACVRACDEMMCNYESTNDLVVKVRALLSETRGAIPTLPEVASSLCMSARTLRRRLEAMETSYSEILDGVRKSLAIRYVSTTQLTTETIAERLSYSDAANFSHAFKRWTGEAPRAYRAKLIAGRQGRYNEQPSGLLHAAFAA